MSEFAPAVGVSRQHPAVARNFLGHGCRHEFCCSGDVNEVWTTSPRCWAKVPMVAEHARRFSDSPLPWEIGDALRSGNLPTDSEFDRFLPRQLRLVSTRYWTPVRVAARAAAWLDELQIRSMVDVGSGAGKFCVAAALMSRCAFLGIEHRKELVATARALADVYGVRARVSFLEETFGDAPLPFAEAYYFYNPFVESALGPEAWLDENVEHGACRHDRDLLAVEHWLGQAPTGTYVMTYNGIGTELPRGYRQIRVDGSLPCVLRLYRKTADRG
jgi:hypothetical protein